MITGVRGQGVKSLSEEALFDTNEMTSSKRYLHTPSEFARKKLIYVQEKIGRAHV